MKRDIKLQLSENSIKVLERRYLAKDGEGRIIETPEQLFRRVADALAKPDRLYGADDAAVQKTSDTFFDTIASLEFMPNSPTLMNAGRPLGQLSACFVLPVGDSMEEIFETIKHAALIHKSGGGTGFAFSRLRPRNSVVASTSGVASGPVSFMKVFNSATEAVKQGGTRRGANMGILRVDHPDILEFVSCKDDLTQVTNFNISVAITDAFMKAVEAGSTYDLLDPRTGQPYTLDGKTQKADARTVFENIVDHAWKTGEPGIVFIDRMNEGNPTNQIERIEATNPCGEQPLPPYDSCNLGSINLGKFVMDPLPDGYSPREPEKGIDWPRLAKAIRICVRFLDNVIDANQYPIPEIRKQSQANRRIGLGVMGWADLLALLNVPYNSETALTLGEEMMRFVNDEGHMESSELAKRRGKFPNWEGSIFAQEGIAMRNTTVTTVAPTGTISIIAGCSSGIEPFYAISFVRNVMEGTRLVDVNPAFEKIAKQRGFYSTEFMERIAQENSLRSFDEIPQDVKEIFVTAADVSPEMHIRMQAVFQKHCDSAVSKTINLPEESTRDDVKQAYWLAYRLKCKGVTIYRDGSRPMQVLSTGKTKDPTKPQPTAPVQTLSTEEEKLPATPHPEERPDVLPGITEKIKTGYGNLYVTINTKDGRPFEVFAQIGKSGYSTMADTEAICRLASLALRSGVPVRQVIEQLGGIGGASAVYDKGALITSIPDAIAKVLVKHFGGGTPYKNGHPDAGMLRCPDCEQPLAPEEGCLVCYNCGFSKC
jgi:ribonucleoside-diphosphate reductase alpha chain